MFRNKSTCKTLLLLLFMITMNKLYCQDIDTTYTINNNLKIQIWKVADFDTTISIKTNETSDIDPTSGSKFLVNKSDFRRTHFMKFKNRKTEYKTDLIDNYFIVCKQSSIDLLQVNLTNSKLKTENSFFLKKGRRVSFELLNRYGEKIIYIYNLQNNITDFLIFESKNVTKIKKDLKK